MKRLIMIVSVLVIMISAVTSVQAANSLKQGTIGMSLGFNNGSLHDAVTISGRYFVMDTMAVIADFGFAKQNGDQGGSFVLIGVGARKYLKKEDFAPFVGGSFRYEKNKIQDNTEMFGIFGDFGAEYFFSKELSVEGSVGIGLESVEDNTVNPSQDYTIFGTTSSGVRVNFYF
jgi:hypothetical protein